MTHIVPFTFESQSVRVADQDGEPWFVLVDVCAVLEISKHRDAASRLDDDERGSVVVDTLGGPQSTIIINESGLWSLVLASRKPAAKRFKKWITSEVIPSIRKTGSYSLAHRMPKRPTPRFDIAREARLSFNQTLRVAKLIGLAGNQAALSANKATMALTGVDMLGLMGAAQLPAPENEALLNPTEIGRRSGVGSARAVNQLLCDMGLQHAFRDAKGNIYYDLTDAGQNAGGQMLDTGKKHSTGTPVRQLKWPSSIIGRIRGDGERLI